MKPKNHNSALRINLPWNHRIWL